ncbi:MAG TPA: pyruvate dehydrogenase (acetyl-transferring) E1 component subunit alpha [Pseudoduganella sp.]
MSAAPQEAQGLDWLLQMLRIRRMEEKCAELYGAGKIRGFLHLYIGEEAVGVGAARALREEDNVVATYREHGQALLRGVAMRAILAEMFGKQAGCSRGRGGSMHLFDRTARFYGGNAIVGAGLPLAAGLALADLMRGRAAVTACFFGDGAVAEGAFHETLNLAALWSLPVLFICENNLYAMGTALERAQSQTDLSAKAASYRIESSSVDGMDVQAVHTAVSVAAQAIRERPHPVFLEMRTYRFCAHSMFDPELYRERAEVERWRSRDPIASWQALLSSTGVLTDGARAAMELRVDAEIGDAVSFADAAAAEPVERLLSGVYAEGQHEAQLP